MPDTNIKLSTEGEIMRTDTHTFHTVLYVGGKAISFWFGNHHKRAVLELDKLKRGLK